MSGGQGWGCSGLGGNGASVGGFIFWPMIIFCFGHAARLAGSILFPQLGIEPRPSAVKVPSPNHWTTREFLIMF